MNEDDLNVSRRVLNCVLFNLGYTHHMPADDVELRLALTKALLPIVGGCDGLAAAMHVLQRPENGARNAHT